MSTRNEWFIASKFVGKLKARAHTQSRQISLGNCNNITEDVEEVLVAVKRNGGTIEK